MFLAVDSKGTFSRALLLALTAEYRCCLTLSGAASPDYVACTSVVICPQNCSSWCCTAGTTTLLGRWQSSPALALLTSLHVSLLIPTPHGRQLCKGGGWRPLAVFLSSFQPQTHSSPIFNSLCLTSRRDDNFAKAVAQLQEAEVKAKAAGGGGGKVRAAGVGYRAQSAASAERRPKARQGRGDDLELKAQAAAAR